MERVITLENSGLPKYDCVKLNDGLENLVSGQGTSDDKRMGNRWIHSGRNRDWTQLSVRYREDWLCQKVIKVIPEDATRMWRNLSTPEATKADKHFKIANKFAEASKWARLYGTSFILIDVKGGGDLDQPLKINKLKEGCIVSLQVVDRTRLTPIGPVCLEPLSPQYGMPEYYNLVYSTEPIHYSRLIRFEGTELPLFESMNNLWFSDSVLIPLLDPIDNFHTTYNAAAQLCLESNVDIIQISGLRQILESKNGEESIMKRLRVFHQGKGLYGTGILDEKEKYDRKSIQLSGIKDLIWECLKVVSAAVGIPATRFLCASPDGMNATGESDLTNYIDTISGYQTAVFNPRLEIIDQLLSIHFGLEEFDYEWKSIFPEDLAGRAKRTDLLCKAVSELVKTGILSSKKALEVLDREDIFHTDLDGQVGTPFSDNENKE